MLQRECDAQVSHCVGPRDRTEVLRFGDKFLYAECHLTDMLFLCGRCQILIKTKLLAA